MRNHNYHEVLRAILEDAVDNNFEYKNGIGFWHDLNPDAVYSIMGQGFEIRRKKRVILINGFEVPEPLRVAPEHLRLVFYTDLTGESTNFFWANQEWALSLFKNGLLHSNAAAANTHFNAITSFTKNS